MSLEAGSKFGVYEIVAPLGRGGMGTVYRARDTRLQRDVAIKFLNEPGLAQAGRSARALLHEARAVSALNHPNICTVYEVGDRDGESYIAMEHVEGRTLGGIISGGALPIETAVRIGMQIADALEHAHERNLIHRDLKSANVIVTPRGSAKVLDFGLATRMTAAADMTRSGTLGEPGIAGTVAYMAPEALRGEIDARSDIWSLGVVLYEMVAGGTPFSGKTSVDMAAAIVHEPPAPLPARAPAGVRAIIQRCLTKDPAQRYQHASEVRAALETALSAIGPAAAAPAARGRWVILAAVAAVILAMVALDLGGVRSRLGGSGPAPAAAITSLAVLPLENLSRDPDQEFFADGMTDALITDLSKIGALRVIARASVMRYKGGQTPIREIASTLKVDGIVTGTVTRSGNRVRITAQLIEAATDRNLWANGYDGDLGDALTLQNTVARAIADEIKVSVTAEERARLTTARRVDPAAHEAYLRGRAQVDKRTREGFDRAVEQFSRAIQLDRNFAEPYAGLADAYALMGYFGFLPSRDAFARSKAAAATALEKNEVLAEAHEALAMVSFFDWEWSKAEPEFQRAIALNPNYATAHHWYSHYLVSLDRDAESIASSLRALKLEPLNANIAAHLAWAYYYADRYDEAIEQSARTLELDPTYYQGYFFRAMALAQKGRFAEAIADFNKALALPAVPKLQILGPLGNTYARAGERDNAERVLKEFAAGSSNFAVNPELAAQIFAGLGQKTRALDLLEGGYASHSGQMLQISAEPAFRPLRSEPRFQKLVKQMGLAK